LFECFREVAVSEDGALHAEKFFWTVWEEHTTVRPAFRDQYLIGLARVSASQCGWPAPGREQALQLLRT
jgi:hypothetical protein